MLLKAYLHVLIHVSFCTILGLQLIIILQNNLQIIFILVKMPLTFGFGLLVSLSQHSKPQTVQFSFIKNTLKKQEIFTFEIKCLGI